MEFKVFTPRWGQYDVYTVVLSREQLEIDAMGKKVKCKWMETADSVWEPKNESLYDIFANDMIQPPADFQRALESAWRSWRNGELDDAAAEAEIRELFDWLNATTAGRPKSAYWQAEIG